MMSFGPVKFSRTGQLKTQQMAFMIVALVVFFSLVGLIYFSISLSGLRSTAESLEEQEAREIVQRIADSPELSFTSSGDCPSCVDFDKAYLLKGQDVYQNFWNLDYLMIERVYPPSLNDECDEPFYPDCSKITIISSADPGQFSSAYITLARWDQSLNTFRYEIGRVHASGAKLNAE